MWAFHKEKTSKVHGGMWDEEAQYVPLARAQPPSPQLTKHNLSTVSPGVSVATL
jgi:hypothetical protein